MIELGRTYEDKITGFKGVATGYVKYITGCNQALLVPKVKEDGSKINSSWIDEQRLEATEDEVISIDNSKAKGCDMSPPCE